MRLLERMICYLVQDSKKTVEYEDWEEYFDELTKVLIILSKPIDYQKEAIGNGRIAEELWLDFTQYFSEDKCQYVDYELITPFQLDLLNKLETIFKQAKKKESKLFWIDNEYLGTNKTWTEIQQLSKQVLIDLGGENWCLKPISNANTVLWELVKC